MSENKEGNKTDEGYKKHSKIVNIIYIFIIVIVMIVILPFILNMLIINNNVFSKAGNDGWVSFWGSYAGGIFGGAGTLIALTITTSQARKYQEQNIVRIDKSYEENKKQLLISNLNEILNDLNRKFIVYNKLIQIVALNDKLANKQSYKYEDIIDSIEKVQKAHFELNETFGIVGNIKFIKLDGDIMQSINDVYDKAKDFTEEYNIKNRKDNENKLKKICDEYVCEYEGLYDKIKIAVEVTKKEIIEQSRAKYKILEK